MDIPANDIALIHAIVFLNDLDKVKNLVEQGADIHAFNDAAIVAAIQQNNLEIVEFLLEKGVDKNIGLFKAVYYSKLELVKYFLEQGSDLSVVINLEKTIEQNIEILSKYEFISKEDIQLAYIMAQSKQLNAG